MTRDGNKKNTAGKPATAKTVTAKNTRVKKTTAKTEKTAKPAMAKAPTQTRELILDILLEILEKGQHSHVVLRQALEKYQYLPKSDRAFITRTVEGTIERLITIDGVLDLCSNTKVKKMKPVIRTILRMSVYQMLWMDRIPDRAVCSEAVNLAEKRHFAGLKGFVNGVLRSVSRRKEEFDFPDWEKKYSMPDWLIENWKSQYGSKATEQMLQAFLAEMPTTVRCNLDRASLEEIRESLEAQGVTVTESPLLAHALQISGYDYLESLDAFETGWIQVQDASSALVGQASGVREGELVLDVCGAPGGKSLDLADRLKGSGQVVVRDLTESKIALVEDNIYRSGFTNIRAEVWDAREFDPEWENGADLVLADLPCSGLGIIGKKPDIKYQASPEKIHDLAVLQREILETVTRYVKPGGRLVYSTCTISPEENEKQREWILANFPFEPVDLTDSLGSVLAKESLKDGYVQLLPGKYRVMDSLSRCIEEKKTKRCEHRIGKVE